MIIAVGGSPSAEVKALITDVNRKRKAEFERTASKTGATLESLASQVNALVVTLGARGSLVLTDGERHEIPCVEAEQVVDPTGCGDAYRAGLLHGIAAGWDWPTSARLGAVMGAIKIAHRGGQNHRPSRDEIDARFRGVFDYSPWSA